MSRPIREGFTGGDERHTRQEGAIERSFVSASGESQRLFREAVVEALDTLEEHWWNAGVPFEPTDPVRIPSMPSNGQPLPEVVRDVGRLILAGGVNPSHPKAVGHMHCLPTMASIVAELLIGATNQSLDSWDESPAATGLEQELIRRFCEVVGLPSGSGGTMDAGATMANQAAMLLAREDYLEKNYGSSSRERGVPPDLTGRLLIVCSEEAHFSIDQAAAFGGIGTQQVRRLPVDEALTIDLSALSEALAAETKVGNLPFLIVATAGTTNAGNIPDIRAIAALARKYRCWFHVDAAYGGALLLSERYRTLLAGIELADSIALDPHKLLFQSVSCGMLLVRDETDLRHFTFHSEYLSPAEPQKRGSDGLGHVNLVDHSLQTTRRFDALKLYMSLRSLGTKGFDEVISSTIDCAQFFANLIDEDPMLELATWPQTNIVLFRYVDTRLTAVDLDLANDAIQQDLYNRGHVILSRTRVRGIVFLKATCMNPLTSPAHFAEIVQDVTASAELVGWAAAR